MESLVSIINGDKYTGERHHNCRQTWEISLQKEMAKQSVQQALKDQAATLRDQCPTGAGLLHVGRVGSREALGQVPEQQLARRSSHARHKNKSQFAIMFIYKIGHKKSASTRDWPHYSLLGPRTRLHMFLRQSVLLKLSQQTLSAAFKCCSKFCHWYKPCRHIGSTCHHIFFYSSVPQRGEIRKRWLLRK